jgi:hypothetical protein
MTYSLDLRQRAVKRVKSGQRPLPSTKSAQLPCIAGLNALT